MTVPYRLAMSVAALLAGLAAVSGCTGLPDRDEQVQRLDTEISAMPGVARFDPSYANDYTSGSYLKLTVWMSAATESQVVDVARRIEDIKQRDFDGYRQETKFVVGKEIELEGGVDPQQLSDRTRRLRHIGSKLPGAEITWTGTKIAVRKAPAAAETFAAVRSGLGPEPARVAITPAGAGPLWEVDFPFGVEQERHLASQVAAFPFDVRFLSLERGFPSILIVAVRDPKTAYVDLTAVIATLRPTREHPMRLVWHSGGKSSGGLEFAGSVHVAGCEYPRTAGEQDPGQYYTPDALELQRRLRDEFDACR